MLNTTKAMNEEGGCAMLVLRHSLMASARTTAPPDAETVQKDENKIPREWSLPQDTERGYSSTCVVQPPM